MLKGKVALITGGANGIGKATAQTFLENGAEVIIWDVDEVKGNAFAQECQAKDFKVKFYRVDITDLQVVQKAADQAKADFGKIDILINNAGIVRDASLKKMTAEQWNSVIAVNLTGVFNCTKCITPFMVEQQFGRVLNASSVVGIYGNFGQTNYVAAKSGVIGMTKVWARELGKHGITVNAVAPGFIKTEMIESIPDQVLEGMMSRSSIKRVGSVQDIAHAYLFLASDMASFITSTTLSVDGGLVV